MKEKTRTTAVVENRLGSIRLVFFFFLLIVAYRLFQVQILNYGTYQALASGQHDILAKLIPERGSIYIEDPINESGTYPVAVNKPMNFIYAVPRDVKDAKETATKLSEILKIPIEDIEYSLSKPNDPFEPIKHAVGDAEADQVRSLNLSGIQIVTENIRFYTDGTIMSQVTGFVGYVGDRKQGRYGVEQHWEKVLAGTPGVLKSEKDALGQIISVGERDMTPASNGGDVYLTIDKNIQYAACSALDRAVKKHGAVGGTVVIMEPATGEIKAVCNSPSFDANNFASTKNIGLFLNNAVTDSYEPGSIFKPFTMAAALDRGKVTPATTYIDTGEVRIGPNVIRNSDLKAHGIQTMTQVLESSLNTGVIFAVRQIGRSEFLTYVKKFGFGEATGLELPQEASGNINSLNDIHEIYTATASFGQGVTATPIQLVAAYGAIANQGKLMQPHIMKKIVYADGKVENAIPRTVRQVISPQVATTLSAMLVNVVEYGHGKRAGVPGYYVAGKTGTAQVPLPNGGGYAVGKNIGSFAGFAPVDKPKFVMLVRINEPQDVAFAESSAAPLFGELAKYLLNYYRIAPERVIISK